MKIKARWRRPFVAHAIRVAVVATVIIGAMYACVVVRFNVLDRHRLLAQEDTRLSQRLDQAARDPAMAAAIANYDNAHDVDDAPVFFWKLDASRGPVALTPGAPALPRSDAAPMASSYVVNLGHESFRLRSQRVGGEEMIAGQSLAPANHVENDLIALEVLAGPVLLLAVFCGTLIVGLKAAGPVEVARRRQIEFTADASHELRTPLSVIEAEVSLALSADRRSGDYRETLVRVGRESARLRDIVEDLLWLSRFDSQPPLPKDEPIDVSVIALACADRFGAVAKRRGVTISVLRQGEGQPLVDAPPEWVDRLTGVLVDNACRYAGLNGEVRLTVGTHGNRVSLTVDDNGPGITPDGRPKLFDRFHRATDEGNGAGLGLAIGDAVVRATGGEWRVGSSPMGGARMEVRWHRSPAAKEASPAPEPEGPVEAACHDDTSVLG